MASDGRGRHAHRVGVVTGLASESAVVTAMLDDGAGEVSVLCAGASAERAGQRARELVRDGAEALLSFGVAGATDPDLQSGDLIVAESVLLDEDGKGDRFPCDANWRAALNGALASARLPCHGGMLIGSAKLWRDPKDKEGVFARTGAVAADMESGAVGAVAAKAGLPFLAVRAIADRARDALPALVTTAVRPDGRTAVSRVLAALARRPGDIPGTIGLARRAELALARLRMLEAVKAPLLGRF